mmetsp:Transcript_124528/g.387737  ORF Transcript_124528/g.387737 Transcript_124528/m.387737 type:complete len:361 (-) Transcript_124528:989-2071(-)
MRSMCSRPHCRATSAGFCPSKFCCERSAPARINSSTQVPAPCCAAMCSGAQPSSRAAFTCARCSRSSAASTRRFEPTAKCRGRSPSRKAASTSARCSRTALMAAVLLVACGKWPRARCKGVSWFRARQSGSARASTSASSSELSPGRRGALASRTTAMCIADMPSRLNCVAEARCSTRSLTRPERPSRTARFRGVCSSPKRQTSTSAPASSRAAAAPVDPACTAWCRAVSSMSVRVLTSALASRSSLVTSVLPPAAAACRGICPWWLHARSAGASGAIRDRSSRQTPAWPRKAPSASAESPSSFVARISARWSSRSPTTWAWPCQDAWWMAVSPPNILLSVSAWPSSRSLTVSPCPRKAA